MAEKTTTDYSDLANKIFEKDEAHIQKLENTIREVKKWFEKWEHELSNVSEYHPTILGEIDEILEEFRENGG